MHWKGLRIGSSDSNEAKRRSYLFEPNAQARHSEHIPRPTLSTTNLNPRRSESAPRSPSLAGPEFDEQLNEGHGDHGLTGTRSRTDDAGPRPRNTGLLPLPGSGPNWRINRFISMRLRHASDPQLSKSYAKGEKDIPPIPELPPPTIITTAPTGHEVDEPVKRKAKFKFFPDNKKSSVEELPIQQGSLHGRPRHVAQGSTGSQAADTSRSIYRVSGEEPGRLSTTSIRSNGRDHLNESNRSSVVDVRFSESSRSDHSSGDHGAARTVPSNEGSISSAKRFRMPRLKRNRNPLFPLPPKPTGSQSMNGRTPRSLNGQAGPKPTTPDAQDQDNISPLPSPSRSAGVASPRPPLLRNDSANSAHSAHSTPSTRNRNPLTTRARSSTLDSLANMRSSEPQASPHLTPSGRTSTSTSGRKSFGDIFNIPQRLRQNSEPPFPRSGSPAARGAETPATKMPSYPARQEDDTPATYLERLEGAIPKCVIASVLSQSNDEFYKHALRKYMRGFSFFGDPIDMAIRKLLMEVELPKETQQIDRFLQSFADRYHECNPGIFANPDQAYFIAFSILILHTDVFNKNNKRKMQKPDYVRNTRGEGITEAILECFYENISYTPFIHIEDTNPNGRHLAKPRRTLFKTASSDHLGKEPVDPYTLIMDNKLDSLRPSLKDVMNLDDTYSCDGTEGPPDIQGLHRAFSKSAVLQIVSARSRPDAFMPSSMENPIDSSPGLVDIKVAKVGLLWRKDPKKKKARSPWQEWGALLTFSKLYFFRDVNWVKSLIHQHESHEKEGRRRAFTFRPPLTDFKPDGMMPTEDAVALLDSSYKKHKNAFVYVRSNALEEVFLANSEADMNDWLAKLNYAAAFKTTGVRSKGMIATNYEAQRNRMSRRGSAASLMDREPPSPNPAADMGEDLLASQTQLMRQKIREANEKLFVSQRQLDDLLRNARHLQVLTPVHSRAREQVIMAAGRMAAKLKWVRQDIWRTRCYREVLVRDLGEEEKEVQPVAEQPRLQLQIPAPSTNNAVEVPCEETETIKVTSPMRETSPHPVSAKPPSISQPSPHPASADLRRPSIPASFASYDQPDRAGRRLSVDVAKERAMSSSPDRSNRLTREASVLSAASRLDVASLGSHASKLTVPNSFEEGEERILRETGLLDVSRRPSLASKDNEAETRHDDTQARPSIDRTSRIRRSLHRTLRDAPGVHANHPRSKKSRDSAASLAALDDTQGAHEGEGLSRKSASFTVHGKKASIVTFGSEWQNMPPEERLKLRKPTPSDEPRATDPEVGSGAESITSENNLHPRYQHSLRSTSPRARESLQFYDEMEEFKEASETLSRDKTKGETDEVVDSSARISEVSFSTAAQETPKNVVDEPLSPKAGSSTAIDEQTSKLPPSSPEQAVHA
ncbi:Arf family guanine nucleotide exchange factor SYT1 [Aspergillus homomorphus CBS 101889]|uniref:Guanyl-nucleotide exchange factor n=1 Tax=Aspergillus homomorphus (strain CBS 101889) TaxID=1450537 RepID=A0A395I4L5_ASPHC|nr:guanyl-nucleotide exchange factor [Aspergillus homomorphus CBS 101889]RAL15152.1 guanyl-nucleotide exchange factor [Aspergillus homomorphus CBS 101889]